MKNPSEFVVHSENYNKVVYGTQVLINLHFKMMSKLEESSCAYIVPLHELVLLNGQNHNGVIFVSKRRNQ